MSLGLVLIMDDEPSIRLVVRRILTKAGYEVLEAENGEKAVALMRNGQQAARVDTIVCDLEMPAMDGSQAISHFKTLCPAVPVVIMTGASDFVLTEVLRSQGVTDYLLKPVSDKKLLEVIRVAVNLRQLRRKQDGV